MPNKVFYTWEQFFGDCEILIQQIPDYIESVYGVPRGGIPLAIRVASVKKLRFIAREQDITETTLIVDDIIDSGKTRRLFDKNVFFSIHNKDNIRNKTWSDDFSAHKTTKEWIVYPWETNEQSGPEDSIIRQLEFIGEDANREGLIETPKRVIKSWGELYSGYDRDPKNEVKVFNNEGCNEIILLKDIEIYSTCEHHLLPFLGQAHIGYIPNKKIVGISKLARITDIFAKRVQIQERLTEQITDCIQKLIKPLAVGCVIEAQHLCMRMRGVGKQNSIMTTSSLKGVFIEDSESGRAARNEFMRLIK
jgi:GTP cyclohydrolase I